MTASGTPPLHLPPSLPLQTNKLGASTHSLRNISNGCGAGRKVARKGGSAPNNQPKADMGAR